MFVSSQILSGLGSVASQEIGELVNTWVGRPGQAWSVIFRASEHGYQVSTAPWETCRTVILGAKLSSFLEALDLRVQVDREFAVVKHASPLFILKKVLLSRQKQE